MIGYGIGSAALAAAVALPIEGDENFQQENHEVHIIARASLTNRASEQAQFLYRTLKLKPMHYGSWGEGRGREGGRGGMELECRDSNLYFSAEIMRTV